MDKTQLKILLIGCTTDEARHIRTLLATAGDQPYACEHAEQAQEGLARLAQDGVHIVLFDVSRSGLEMFLQARTQMLKVPIVVLACSEEKRLAVEAVQKGAQDYLLKEQFDHLQLVRSLRLAMERQQFSDEIEEWIRKLQASEASLHNVVLSNADGMIIVDQQGTILFMNPAAEELLGRSAKELLGARFELSPEPGRTQQYEIRRQGQEARTAEVRFVETTWEGRLVYLASLRDISERKRLERLKDEFVSKVSHELRTPLTSIKGTVTLMLNRALGEINAEQQDFLETVNQDIDRLAELINNVLDLSKMEAGKMVISRQRVNPADLIEHSCRSHHVLLGGRKVVRQLAPIPPVYVDRNLILQVIGNLLGNAIKFTPEDGTITFGLRAEKNAVAVSIADNGPGMPADKLGRLFQKFVQVDQPGSESPKGTGLGLAICREIVELHHGDISVASEPGKGTVFTFTLPIDEPATMLDKFFEEVKASLGAEQVGPSLLRIDLEAVRGPLGQVPGRSLDEILLAFEETIRKSVAKSDRVVLSEPMVVAVLAATDAVGAEAIRKRLEGVCLKWLGEIIGSQEGGRIEVAVAVSPSDGASPAELMRHAKAQSGTRREHG